MVYKSMGFFQHSKSKSSQNNDTFTKAATASIILGSSDIFVYKKPYILTPPELLSYEMRRVYKK